MILKYYNFCSSAIISVRVFYVWPKTTHLLPMWPREALEPFAHEAFFSTCLQRGELWFAIWRPVKIEMTSLPADYLTCLLDLKDRICSIFRLCPGMLVEWEQAGKQLFKQASCAAGLSLDTPALELWDFSNYYYNFYCT